MPTSAQVVLEENERLRREIAELRRAASARRHPGRVRQILVNALVFLSCLGILTSTLTIWSNTTLLNTNTYMQIVGPIAQNNQVITAVSGYAADQVVTLLNVQQRTQQALPPKITFLAVPLTQVVRNFTQASIARLMHTPTFQQVWITVNQRVHDELLAALRGQSTTLHISNGVVTLNLIPIIDEGLQYLQQHLPGFISQHVKLPSPTQLQLPQQAQQRLSQALGVSVPANFGQIQLFQSAKLARAQQLLKLWDLLTVVLPIITAVLIFLALWFSADRRVTLIALGIGTAVAFILAKIATGYLQRYIVNATTNPTAKSVVQPAVQMVVSSLSDVTTWLLIGGIVLAIVAYLVGKPQWFRAAYSHLRSAYRWIIEKFQNWRHRHAKPAAAAG